MRLLGQTQHGIYAEDPMDNVHPDTLKQYYGVMGSIRNRPVGQTGAGHPDDEPMEEDSSDEEADETDHAIEELENQIEGDQEQHIRHKPIKVATHQDPFPNPNHKNLFLTILQEVRNAGLIPAGYGARAEEWEGGQYLEESIKFSKKKKELIVTLPSEIWLPRAILWVQALDIMMRLGVGEH
ncbi:hypothetical protein SCP_0502370 [Sparassis crispa]|uniref:Uncharacterized protein n=1 Tax=Sparassis crispa TaxID=139825 RepID=A0A401GLZ4_9APHY|nr:hypothetical protein SCP_0502370 [Sparassis crispa]GBE83190.1 hypothetical protein SCP_0502370 [Sparassis crispa]